MRNERPIISFNFDDFPASAIRIGGPILARYGIRATYYVSMSLLRDAVSLEDDVGFTADDLRAVVAEGHEIACHTWGHLDCALTAPEALISDMERNAAALAEIIPGYRMTNFAYPFGNLDLASKRLMAERFDTARGIWTGINADSADMALLTAQKIYEGEGNYRRALKMMDDLKARSGWLILFTHDVRANHSPFGSTPQDLERMAAAARESGCDILTMREAVAAIGGA